MLSYIVKSRDGEIIKEHEPARLLMPASNVKMFISAAALDTFDPSKSPCLPAELIKISENALVLDLKGNLIFSFRYGKSRFAEMAIKKLASQVIAHNVKKVYLFCPKKYFKPIDHYPCVSFINYNENTFDVICKDHKITTNPKDQNIFTITPKNILTQERVGNHIYVDTQVDSQDFWRLEDENWTAFQIKKKLREFGIHISVEVTHHKDRGESLAFFEPFISTKELISSSLTHSDNFRAEMLGLYLRSFMGDKNLDNCLDILREKIQFRKTFLTDASGLSRRNVSSCEDICNLLVHMINHTHSEIWRSCLAKTGENGTLKNASKYDLNKGSFTGKTGTLKDVKALSGYYINKKGRELCISMIQNDSNCTNFSESFKKLITEIDER